MKLRQFPKVIFSILVGISLLVASVPQRPFPQEQSFPGCIKPEVGQPTMNSAVTNLYEAYKKKYLVKSTKTSGGYYYSAYGTGEDGATALTVSEQHGYGMIISVLMAGYDPMAKEIFDGMYAIYRAHPSKLNPINMAWVIGENEKSDNNSATDGDMDIAYSLLLAHWQWGSAGKINYQKAAQDLITGGIKENDISYSSYRTVLGDWSCYWDESADHYSSRSSDWMTGHMKAFYETTKDPFWLEVRDTTFSMIRHIRKTYSAKTGLMPDFVTGKLAKPDPKSGGATGESYSDSYWYNACRFPWRMAADFAHYGNAEAKKSCDAITTWLKSATKNNPKAIVDGYKLDGTPIKTTDSPSFTGPFAAAMITDSSNQEYLNMLWSEIDTGRGYDSYGAALNILSLLMISGNWWIPNEAIISDKEFTLTVENGSGSKTVRVGTPVTVEASTKPGLTFVQWAGDVPSEVNAQSSTLQFTMPYRSVYLKALYKDPLAKIDTAALSSSIHRTQSWNGRFSGKGSSVTVDSSASNSVTLSVVTGNDDSQLGYAWAKGLLASQGDYSAVNLVKIQYRSSEAFWIMLDQARLDPSGGSHYVELPASAKDTTVYIPLTKFIQPSWTPADMIQSPDMKDLQSISIQGAEKNATVKVTISGVQLNRYAPIPLSSAMKISHKNGSVLKATIQNRNLHISGVELGSIELSLYDIRGRLMVSSKNVTSGGTTILPDFCTSASGVYFLKMRNNLNQGTSRIIFP